MSGQRRPVALVVDDDARSRDLLQQLLVLDGYEVRSAPGGAAALTLLTEEVPDVAVVDLRMPGMDGLELCRRIRGLEHAGRGLTLVMLTGMDDATVRQAGYDAGADEVLSKPVDRAELRDRLRRARVSGTVDRCG
jgi:CheY-like chemotaxis protein